MKEVILNRPEDVKKHVVNMLEIMAMVNLKEYGVYHCVIGGQRTCFKIRGTE